MAAQPTPLHTCLNEPAPDWDGRLPRSKRNWWLFFWANALVMALIAALWFVVFPNHEIPNANRSATPAAFHQMVEEFVSKYETAPGSGIVRVPPGVDAYLEGRMWGWYPVLELKAGRTYTIWLSSVDVVHTLEIAVPARLEFDAVPGHMYGLTLTPTTPGNYLIYCGEYCGLGHQDMASRIIVDP